MTTTNLKPYQIFRKRFGMRNLKSIYEIKLAKSPLKGVDRLSGDFLLNKKESLHSELRIVSRKALDSTYRFSPYLELLKGKGRGKAPRVLAVPTVRDRVALYALKEVLFDIFPDCVNRKFANSLIHEIKQDQAEEAFCNIGFFRTDIHNFYGEIDRDALMKLIATKGKVRSKKILSLIEKAITRPVVPKIYKKNELRNYEITGIPQGLSISNILAEIYLHELDSKIRGDRRVIHYSRYVDDILVIASKSDLSDIVNDLRIELEAPEKLGLKLNKDKTYTNILFSDEFHVSDSFEYLGYQFNQEMIASPKKSSVEKLIRSVTGLFCEYKNAFRRVQKSRKKKENKELELDLLKKTFLFRLNEKITGAISDKKRYGWLFYFSEINDISSLYRIDSVISNLFKSLDAFDKTVPRELKKLSRTYYEARYSPRRGYIHNYNNYQSLDQRRQFLIDNGYIRSDKPLSLKKINRKFYNIMRFNLSKLIADETFLY